MSLCSRPKRRRFFSSSARQHSVGEREGQIFVKFSDRLFLRLRGQLVIQLLPTPRIEQLHTRFRQIARRFIETRAQ